MREHTALQMLPTDTEASADNGRASAERIGLLVRRAIMFLDSDRQVAWRCLSDASALLGPPTEASSGSDPITGSPFRPGGLARWQARRAVAYIDANLESKLEVQGLAELASLSKSHFSRAFKRSLGLPPMAYVMLRRVERAKVLMTSTTRQLTEIALICGFADQSHLNRSFRRIIGVSPGRWRHTNVEVMGSISRRQEESGVMSRMANRGQGRAASQLASVAL